MKTKQEIDYSGWFEAENIIFGIKSKAIQPDLGISRKFTNELAPSGATYTELMEIISQLDQKVVSYNLPGFRLSLQQTHDVLKVGTVILRYFTIYIQKENQQDVGNYRPASTLPIFGYIWKSCNWSHCKKCWQILFLLFYCIIYNLNIRYALNYTNL